jgi:hypothetical protein
MRITFSSSIAILAIAAAPLAGAMPITEAHIPVKASEWGQLSEDARSGYALGAMQVAAYIESDTIAESGCIARLDDALVSYLDAGAGDADFVVFDAMEMAMESCGDASAEDDGLLSVEHVSSVLADHQTSDVWYGMVIGITDYLKVQVFGNMGEEAADCVEDISLGMAGVDLADPYEWTDDPSESFVSVIAGASLTACGLMD